MSRVGGARIWTGVMVAFVAWAWPAAAVTYTWTGGGGLDINWSNPANWGGAGPSNGEADVGLMFPPLDGAYATNNDLSSLRVSSLAIATQLSGGDYAFGGNLIILEGPAAMSSPGTGDPNLVWQIPIALAADVTIATDGRQTQMLGAIDLGFRTLRLDATGDILLVGPITGEGRVEKDNGSALTILGDNSYRGLTIVNRGAVYIGSPTAFGDINSGTTFFGGFLGFRPGSTFTTAEPFVFDGGGILAYGTPTMVGEVLLDGPTEIEAFEPGTVLTISGTLGGTDGLTKTGPGLLVLDPPAALYDGATAVDAGELRLESVLSGAAPVFVGSGATLSGSGSIGGTIAVDIGGRLSPGASAGELHSTGLTMAAAGVLDVEIDGPETFQYDRIAVDGAVDLQSATLEVTLGFVPTDGQQFTLISQQAAQPVRGTFAGLPEGAAFEVGGTTFGITYVGGAGNDVVLLAGPPPTRTATAAPPTGTPTPTETGAANTATPTAVNSATSTATATATAVATATVTPRPCVGDCSGDGTVTVNEIVIGVNIALGNDPVSACPAFDATGDGQVTITDLILGVTNLLNGCPMG